MNTELETIRFIRDLPTTEHRILSKYAFIRKYKAGDVIFEKETETQERFVGYLTEGVALISFIWKDDTQHEVETFDCGPIGLGFLDGFNTPGTVIAKTDIKLIGWSLQDIELIIEKHPRVATTLYKGMNFYLIQHIRSLIGTIC